MPILKKAKSLTRHIAFSAAHNLFPPTTQNFGMATNKHATIRYQALDKCFRNPGRKYFIDDLTDSANLALQEFTGINSGVKNRQIYDDIKFMESSQGWDIPLARLKDGRRIYYRYETLDFSINNQPLNQSEEKQLREALITLSRFKGMPQFVWIDELVAKLEQGLSLSKRKEIIIEFEQNQYLRGLKFITPIYEAIQNEQTLFMTYRPFNHEEKLSINLSPYYLKQFNNRWFLFGKSEEYDNLTNLALDRVINIESSKNDYIKNLTIDFSEYFEDIIGVTIKSDELVDIEIQVDKSLIDYIKTKPIHGSQKFKDYKGDHGIFLFNLIPNFELETLILSHGEKIKVIRPETLKKKIESRLSKALEGYNE